MTVYRNECYVCHLSSSRILKLNIITIYIQVFLIGPEGSGLSQSGIVDMIKLLLSKLSRDPYIKFGSG